MGSKLAANVKSNTWAGPVRAGHKGATPGTAIYVMRATFDPTQASAGLGIILPKGVRVLDVANDGNATGGAGPTINVGTAADPDAFVEDAEADAGPKSALAEGTTGALWNTELTDDTEVYAGVGSSAATGGTTEITISYFYQDDQQHDT